MKQQLVFLKILLLGITLLGLASCGPLDWFNVTPSSDLPPAPEITGIPADQVPQPTIVNRDMAVPVTVAPIPLPSGPTFAWKSFTSPKYGYVIAYPAEMTATVEDAGTIGDAVQVERVVFKLPTYGPFGQSSNIAIEVAQHAYSRPGQCQGQTEVVPNIQGCRSSWPQPQATSHERVWFQLPASGQDNVYVSAELIYDDARYLAAFNHMLDNFKYGGAQTAKPPAGWKTFVSGKHHYTVNYPERWTIDVQAPAYSGEPENVYLRPAPTGLPVVQILALKGAPPIVGFENCEKNLTFRGLPACSISLPAGQIAPTKLLVFQKGDSHYQLSMQYDNQQQLGIFDDIVKSFHFTQ